MKVKVSNLESPPLPICGADAVPKSVLVEASNSREEKVQTDPAGTASVLKAIKVQSVVLGTIDPRVIDPVKARVPQQLLPEVCVIIPVVANVSPENIVAA